MSTTNDAKPGPGQLDIEGDVTPDAPPGPEPKRKRGRPAGSKTKAGKTDAPPRDNGGKFKSSKAQLRDGIASAYGMAGAALAISPSLAPVGTAAMTQAEAIADAWVDVAESNAAVRKFWEQILQGSNTSALLMAHLPIALSLLSLRPGLLGPLGSMFGGGGESLRDDVRATPHSAGSTPPPPPPPPPPPEPADAGPGSMPYNPAFGNIAS